MANTTKTHKDYYNDIIAIAEQAGREDLVEFAKGRIEAIKKKSSGKRTNPNAEENKLIKAEILTILENSEAAKTIAMLQQESELMGGLTNQRIASILKTLIDDGKVERQKYKKFMYYFLTGGNAPGGDDEAE